ncbi:hypothetical protein A5686_25620 [Mycobacterium sp. E2479]|nr:hypothetical protein A5686_25620 [Mycobacterium sp. E2479]
MTCSHYIDDRGGRLLQRMQAEPKARVLLSGEIIVSARATVPANGATRIDSLEVWLLTLTNPMKPLA